MKGRTVREMKEELSDQGNEGRMRRTTVRMGLYRLRPTSLTTLLLHTGPFHSPSGGLRPWNGPERRRDDEVSK